MICRKETITYRAKPKIYSINSNVFCSLTPELSSIEKRNFILKGNFLNITNVYLSATNSSILENQISFFNPFSSIQNLSAQNPYFSGFKLNNFSYSENYLAFDFPFTPLTNGYVDVLIENESGYSKLTNETSFFDSCGNKIDFQLPTSYGIAIVIQ
jgi:hypothetical protein